MALGTNFNTNVFFCRTCCNHFTACTSNRCSCIVGMDSLFQWKSPLSHQKRYTSIKAYRFNNFFTYYNTNISKMQHFFSKKRKKLLLPVIFMNLSNFLQKRSVKLLTLDHDLYYNKKIQESFNNWRRKNDYK